MIYRTKGVCASAIEYEIKNGIITKLRFIGGCTGNTQGVAKLCIGKTPEEVISLLSGIQCRGGTSCPDQLARALKQYLEEQI